MQLQISQLPVCPSCEKGIIVPLEDFSPNKEGQVIVIVKGWACTHCQDNRIYSAGVLAEHEVAERKKFE